MGKRDTLWYEDEIRNKVDMIKKLDLQVNTINGQNNLLSISINDKDALLNSHHKELLEATSRVSNYEGQVNRMEEYIQYLRSMKNSGQQVISNSNIPITQHEPTPCEDIFIIHDSLFKEISDGIMKNEKMSVKKIWAPKLQDALNVVKSLESRPKVVLLHSATNDLPDVDVNDIVKHVVDIYEIVKNMNIKFVWSNMVPRNDNPELNAKAHLVNAMIGNQLLHKDGTYIVRNGNFYDGDMVNVDLFDKDGIHVANRGISTLAQNVRITLCRSLNKEFVTKQRRSGFDRRSGR